VRWGLNGFGVGDLLRHPSVQALVVAIQALRGAATTSATASR
jgi:hypothetical protein